MVRPPRRLPRSLPQFPLLESLLGRRRPGTGEDRFLAVSHRLISATIIRHTVTLSFFSFDAEVILAWLIGQVVFGNHFGFEQEEVDSLGR